MRCQQRVGVEAVRLVAGVEVFQFDPLVRSHSA
jgi:hypothetical protein